MIYYFSLLFFRELNPDLKSNLISKSKKKFIQMSFNPDLNYAQKVIFSQKIDRLVYSEPCQATKMEHVTKKMTAFSH